MNDERALDLPRSQVPLALAGEHALLAPGDRMTIGVPQTGHVGGAAPGRPGADDRGWPWPADDLVDVLVGAGFRREAVRRGGGWIRAEVTRERTLPDMVGPGMRLLVCGLNPSVYAADAGVGFARPGNRFWPAAIDAGLVERDRDPLHALRACGIGTTDLVKRATTGAAELTVDEFRLGAGRVERLVRWLRPDGVCFVGLAGWRAAVHRAAPAGLQPEPFGGRPAYVMPSTSGRNARVSQADLAAHLAAALAATSAGSVPGAGRPPEIRSGGRAGS